ncbi:MAG: hypothetical protein AAF399_15405 [Bacteroidota bacterium]
MSSPTLKTFFPFVLGAILALSSCSSFFHVSELTVGPPLAQPLPPLQVEWDWFSLRQSFPTRFESEEVMAETEMDAAEIRYVSRTDIRLQDTKVLMEHTVRDQLCEQLGPEYGYAICRVVGQHHYADQRGFTVLSLASAFLLNVVGMPFARQNTEVVLELEIRDSHDQLVARYQGMGTERLVSGLYYGHNGLRRTHVSALKQALAQIVAQVEADADQVRSALQEAGEIPRINH